MLAGLATSTAAYRFKAALFDAATTLWVRAHPELLVAWSTIGTNVPDEYLLVLGTESDQEPATLSTNRSREETVRLETQWFVTRWGEIDAAREAEDYLYARLGELERYVRMTDTTLGGVVRHCFLVAHVTDTRSFQGAQGHGHLASAMATFEAKIRITG